MDGNRFDVCGEVWKLPCSHMLCWDSMNTEETPLPVGEYGRYMLVRGDDDGNIVNVIEANRSNEIFSSLGPRNCTLSVTRASMPGPWIISRTGSCLQIVA